MEKSNHLRVGKARLSAAYVVAAGLLVMTVCFSAARAQTPLQFIHGAKFGLFVHYVFGLTDAAPGRPPLQNLKRFSDEIKVRTIVHMAQSMDAQYVIFTSYHWRMTTLFPSRVWGSAFPGHSSPRDIVGDLAKALAARGIKLVLYVHPDDRHDFTPAMLNRLVKLGWNSPSLVRNGHLVGFEPHDPLWNHLYYRMLNEIGRRYGQQIIGYFEDDNGAASNGETVERIMNHYTPHAAIWVNGFVHHPPATVVGGENWKLLDHNPRPHIYNTSAAMTADVISDKWGVWWAGGGHVNYSAAQLYRFFICSIATSGQHNGGVAFATGPYSDNRWETGVPRALRSLGRIVRKNAVAIFNTRPSRAFVSGTAASAKPAWGVAVDSADGHSVFLHVLMPPKGPVLRIGRPADGVAFRRAHLLGGGAVKIRKVGTGYVLTLPSGTAWSPLDTVIVLSVR